LIVAAPDERIDTRLERVLASRALAGCPQLQRMLQHIVTLSLEGRAGELKEFSIGVDVFGRPDSYDPKLDAIVRVNARRLRERLQAYYREEGREDPVRIEIAKGAYVATIEPQHTRETLPQKPASPRWWIGLAVTVVVVALALLARFALRSSDASDGLPRSIEPLTTLPGREDQPSWSPDGRSLVFTWTGPGTGYPALYIQDLRGQEPVRLTHSNKPEYRPRWSPDGQRVVFFRRSGAAEYSVIMLERATGKESILGAINFPLNPLCVPGLDWSPDGAWLALTEQDNSLLPSRVNLWSLRDGHHTALTRPQGPSSGDLEVKFSPDGKRLAVLRNAKMDLLVVSFPGGKEERLVMSNNRGFTGVDWLDDSTLVAARHGDDDSAGLWKIPLQGGSPERLTADRVSAESPVFQARTRQLAFVDSVVDIDIWKYSTLSGKGQPVIASTRFDGAPALSPDDRRIAFLSTRSGNLEVWLANADGSNERCLTDLHGTGSIMSPPAWSPDGKLLAIQIRVNSNSDIYLQPAEGGALRRFTSEPSREYFPEFSADGRSVYFASDRSGLMELFRQPLAGGPAVQITHGSVVMGKESGDGHSFLVTGFGHGAEFWRYDVPTNRKTLLFEASGPVPLLTWTVRNHSVFFLRHPDPDSSSADLCRYDLTTGILTRMASFDAVAAPGLAGLAGAGAMGVTADQRYIYAPHITVSRSDLMRIDLSGPRPQ
jgi:Tol biopolymer transport system component